MTVTSTVLAAPSRQMRTGTFSPGATLGHFQREPARIGNRFAVELQDNVAALQAGLGRRAVGHHFVHQRALVVLEVELFGQRGVRG